MGPWWDSVKYQAYRRYLRNPRSQRLFDVSHPSLTEPQRRVVDELRRLGVASVHFDELFNDPPLWSILSRAVDDFVGGPVVQQALDGWKSGERVSKQKGYLIRLFPEKAVVNSDDPWLKLALDSRVLTVVNSYYGLFARLLAFDVWYTIQDQLDRSRRGSQKWHRDPEDQNVVKVFLYFSHVTEGSGPLEYVVRSRLGEPNCHTTYAGVGWLRSEEEFSRVPPQDVVRCTGPKGTLVFCDTAGIHRGGYAVDGPRILATWGYTTPATLHPRRYELREALREEDPSALYAVTCS